MNMLKSLLISALVFILPVEAFATSVALNAGAGGGGSQSATLSGDATDTRGEIILTTGTGASSSGASMLTVTFGSAYGAIPYVHIQRDDTASNLSGLANVTVINRTVSGFDIGFDTGSNLSSIPNLKFGYEVIP